MHSNDLIDQHEVSDDTGRGCTGRHVTQSLPRPNDVETLSYTLNMNWASLVPEIIIIILGNTNSYTIRGCRQVCRRFRQIIDRNAYLQYLLYLDDMGYQPPAILRRDLSFTQMLQILRENRDGWHLNKELGCPSFINISGSKGYNSFVDGIFAYTSGSSKSDEGYKATIHFHQLASINKGIGYKTWYHQIECNVNYIVIQPELDLLVVLSGKGTLVSSYQIHLRTISTNDPHPLAASPTIDLKTGGASRYDLRFQKNLVQIHGRMIGVRFGGFRNPTLKPLVMVWNWVLGFEVVHLELRPAREYSMTFISEEYFLVPELAETVGGAWWSYNQLGRLDIYRIPLDRIAPVGECVASFILPHLIEQQHSVYLEVSTSPSAASSLTQSQPKIYELAPGNHQIHIFITTSIENNDLSNGASHRDGLRGRLYVPTDILLAFLSRIDQPNSASVPYLIAWSEWGSHTSWVSSATGDRMNGFTWGQRHAFRYDVKVETRDNHYTSCKRFCVLDHDRNRVKYALNRAGNISEANQPEKQTGSVAIYKDTVIPREVAERITFYEALASGPRYTEIVMRMEGINELLELNGVTVGAEDWAPLTDIEPLSAGFVSAVIDDEHFVVLVPKSRSTKALAGLLVYNM
ncbi:unnamed protein product [Rhizoctonia solani]|uniref:F-box domain-containing protein n=1 Tax=Rhizoctonia solani TaxID=456999 RepID=A0A8H3DNW2_9AGAM|nr:unnamed protein product [Rhizoctonia solani]